MEGRKAKRGGRLFVDTWRNGYAQLLVAAYSVRAQPGAPVSTPVEWAEVEDTGLSPAAFTMRTVPERLEGAGDPWSGMGRRARGLKEAERRLSRLEAAHGQDATTDATDRWGHRKALRPD
jgi:bifunctional non-homologous end joining protein LigD